jgi:hypothetical protein
MPQQGTMEGVEVTLTACLGVNLLSSKTGKASRSLRNPILFQSQDCRSLDQSENWTRPTKVIRTDSARNISIMLLRMLSMAPRTPKTPRPSANQSLHVATPGLTIFGPHLHRSLLLRSCELTIGLNLRITSYPTTQTIGGT